MSNLLERLREKKEAGAALIIAVILLSAIEILGFALITMSEIDYSVASNLARSEEALYASEQGVMMGIEWIRANPGTLGYGDSTVINSATKRGKEVYGTGADPYPKWDATVTNVGMAPPSSGQVLTNKTYRYLIESVGSGVRGLTRMIKVELGMSEAPKGGGLQPIPDAMDPNITRKLAATTYRPY